MSRLADLVERSSTNRPVVIVNEPLCVIGKHGEALFKGPKFASFIGTAGKLHTPSVFGCFFTILPWREHPDSFL
jgi:hypothetical protein